MSTSKPSGGRLAAFIAMACMAACSKELPPRSAAQFMEEPAVLQGVLAKCNQMEQAASRDAECRAAREAVDRLAAAEHGEQQAIAQSEFERAREARRTKDELQQQRDEARQRVDPDTLPLVKDPAPEPAQTTAAMAPEVKPAS